MLNVELNDFLPDESDSSTNQIPGVRYAAITRRSQVSPLSQLLEIECSLFRRLKDQSNPNSTFRLELNRRHLCTES